MDEIAVVYAEVRSVTIAATTTRTGLRVDAELDEHTYPTGLRISDRQMRTLLRRQIVKHEYHGDWNYDVVPTADDDDEALATPITPTHPYPVESPLVAYRSPVR